MNQGFQIQWSGRRVLVVLGGELAAAHSSEAAHEFARAIRATAEKASLLEGVTTQPESVTTGRYRTTVRAEGPELVVVFEPARILIRWPVAEWSKITAALHHAACRVETRQQAERVARDQAILLRANAGFGLTNDPVIQAEAKKIAEGDRDLRRYMPGGVRAREQFGIPTVTIEGPTP
jgi:hypothetical protein